MNRVQMVIANTEYITVNKFYGNKRNKANLACLTHFYVDCDIYDSPFGLQMQKKYNELIEDDLSNLEIVLDIIHNKFLVEVGKICKSNKIDLPTSIQFSGRGYQLFWEIEAKDARFEGASPKLALVYQIINKSLVNKFKTLGSHARVTDVSRVFKKR